MTALTSKNFQVLCARKHLYKNKIKSKNTKGDESLAIINNMTMIENLNCMLEERGGAFIEYGLPQKISIKYQKSVRGFVIKYCIN